MFVALLVSPLVPFFGSFSVGLFLFLAELDYKFIHPFFVVVGGFKPFHWSCCSNSFSVLVNKLNKGKCGVAVSVCVYLYLSVRKLGQDNIYDVCRNKKVLVVRCLDVELNLFASLFGMSSRR